MIPKSPEDLAIEDAAYKSMREAVGLDENAAAEIGLTNPNNYESQLESGRLVGKLMLESGIPQQTTSAESSTTPVEKKEAASEPQVCGDCGWPLPCGRHTVKDKFGHIRQVY